MLPQTNIYPAYDANILLPYEKWQFILTHLPDHVLILLRNNSSENTWGDFASDSEVSVMKRKIKKKRWLYKKAKKYKTPENRRYFKSFRNHIRREQQQMQDDYINVFLTRGEWYRRREKNNNKRIMVFPKIQCDDVGMPPLHTKTNQTVKTRQKCWTTTTV